MTTRDESDSQDMIGAGQLVVDTLYLDAVRQVLGQLDIVIDDGLTEHAPGFDLSLLTLEHRASVKENKTVSDLDPVLFELRLRLAARCGGWVPPLGKNRPMSSEFGAYPQTKSHALWDPEPVEHKPSGWLEGDQGTGVRVGLLDTEIHGHAHIAENSIKRIGYEKTEKDRSASAYFEEGHGLFMAGLILQEAPRATLVSRAALGPHGKAAAWEVVKQLEKFCTDEPEERVHLLVLASGCRTRDGRAPLIIERAIERLNRRMTVVAAAGNHGAVNGMTPDLHITRDSPTWPAALPGVVAVGVPTPFLDANGKHERNLDYSPKLPWVTGTVNPGSNGEFVSSYLVSDAIEMYDGDIKKETYTSGFASWRGTSCAAARLGGALAAKMPETGMDAQKALDALDENAFKRYSWTF